MGQEIMLSVIIIKGGDFNHEVYRDCFESVSFADEVIEIETDNLNGNFSDFRNMGIKKAKGEWLLYIDTDEIVTPSLRKIILESIHSDKYSAYAIPRRNIVFGHEMKHCGLWPDYVLRLIKKDKLEKWQGELHEQPKVVGLIDHLKEPLIHKKHGNLSEMVTKTNKWSEVEAKLMFEAGHPPMTFLRFASAGIRELWLRLIVQTAFLDGVRGIIYALYQVFSRLISYSKLWELQITHARSNS